MSEPENTPRGARFQKDPLARDLRSLREELWGPIPPAERIQWSNALLDNPPTDLTVMGKFANSQLLQRDGIVMNRQWVAVARHWDDLGVTAYEWLLQKGTLVDATPHHKTQEAEDPWGDCTEHERRAWTVATLQFPPMFLGATIMALQGKHARVTGITNSKTWIDLALEFRAAGFTPEEFLELNAQVRKFFKRGMTNTLITTTWGSHNVQFVRLDAQQWTNWLVPYRNGADPEELTKAFLAPNWVESN
jgi:hypothetical protein